MMAKIRFVASSLLDTLSNPSGDSNGINSDLPVRLQKAQSYLCKSSQEVLSGKLEANGV
jgi:hypothetical protein